MPSRRRRAGAALAPSPTSSKRRDRGKRAERPSDDQREERSVNALLGGVLVWGFQAKAQWCSLGPFWFSWFLFFVAPIPASGPARTAGPEQSIHPFSWSAICPWNSYLSHSVGLQDCRSGSADCWRHRRSTRVRSRCAILVVSRGNCLPGVVSHPCLLRYPTSGRLLQ